MPALALVGELDVSEVERIENKLELLAERVGELRVSVEVLSSRAEHQDALTERVDGLEARLRKLETGHAKLVAYAAVAGSGTAAGVGALFELLSR